MAESNVTNRNAFNCPCTRRGVAENRRANSPGQTTRDFTWDVAHFEPAARCTVRVWWSESERRYRTERV